jgi:parallel beta-helix repeat protein
MSLRMRRGGDVPGTPPPPPLTYGPTLGAQSVRNGAGARTVVDPGGGVSFNSSSSLQAAIDAQPLGTTFVCSVNNPVWSGSVSTGTKQPTIIFPGTPGQKVIDGNGGNFYGLGLFPGAKVYGGKFQNFGTTAGYGIIHNGGGLVQDVTATSCFDVGIHVTGPNVTVSHCTMFDNGHNGYGGTTNPEGLVIEYCNVYGNNTRLMNACNEGGAGKIGLQASKGLFNHNWIHDNIGFGAWWDTSAYDWVIEENVCEGNYFAGLFWEANYGGVIRNNYIANNGRNIAVSTCALTFENMANVRLSDDSADRVNPSGVVTPVQFTRNIVDHTASYGGQSGVLILLWDHSATTLRHVANVDIFENQFWMRFAVNQRIRCEDTATTGYPVWDSDNHFFQNDYRVPTGQTGFGFWRWDTGTGGGVTQTYTQWQTYHPNDNLPLTVI